MKYLLDIHALLWFFKGDTKLSKLATEIIEDNRQIRCALQLIQW